MNIGIVGAGHIGSTLARRFTEIGHTVKLSNSRGPESLRDVEQRTGARAVDIHEAVKDVELIVVTIPMKAVPELPDGLFADVSSDVVVVDTCNYYPQQRDGKIAEIEDGQAESAWVAERIGHTVVKAFNNIQAEHLGENGKKKGESGRIALPIAGDDARAKATVAALIDAIGFDVVDDGALDNSWRQQPGQPAYGADLDADRLKQALENAHRERPTEWRA